VSRADTACLLAVMALAAPSGAQPAADATLTIHVAGLRNARGKLEVCVYKDASGFPETPARAFRREAVAIDARALTAQAVFAGLPPGVYAVAVLHDENANGKLDKNFIGIPREGHGASNDPPPARRPPTFDEAKFTLHAPAQTVEIKPIY
jgi:uncharacterized protein (DUF2141 family)